jgi:NAD(P)-dependent dehydrogenase (short-subunit alcohol dehydrogenase family)
MELGDFCNRVIFITGAAGGFGRLLTEHFHDCGARLVLGDNSAEGVSALRRQYADSADRVLVEACDVSSEDAVQWLVELAAARFGRLDIAINNAGMSTPMRSLIDIDEREFDLNIAVNVKGVFFGMKHQIRQMLTQPDGGTILNVASKAGVGGAPKLAAYSAAKHAVVGLTRTAALEYAKNGIRVNAICPYYSPTPMVANGISESLQSMLAGLSPMKRLGLPQEMVAVMLMLVSPATAYLNGQAIVVDGGMSAG